MIGHGQVEPVYSLPGDGSDATPQAMAADMLRCYHEKVLAMAALVSLSIACFGPLLNRFHFVGAYDRFMTIMFFLVIWGLAIIVLLYPLLGERVIWGVRGRTTRLVGLARLSPKDRRASMTGLDLYEGHLEWDVQNGAGAASAPYSRVAWAAFYGDLLVVSFRMVTGHLPDVVADASGLGREERRRLARFLEERVNAAHKGVEYRRSLAPGAWTGDTSGRVVWGLWRYALIGLALFFLLVGTWMLFRAATGVQEVEDPSQVFASLFMVLIGVWILDSLGGRMLSALRRHPTRRRFHVGRIPRLHPMPPEAAGGAGRQKHDGPGADATAIQ